MSKLFCTAKQKMFVTFTLIIGIKQNCFNTKSKIKSGILVALLFQTVNAIVIFT